MLRKHELSNCKDKITDYGENIFIVSFKFWKSVRNFQHHKNIFHNLMEIQKMYFFEE